MTQVNATVSFGPEPTGDIEMFKDAACTLPAAGETFDFGQIPYQVIPPGAQVNFPNSFQVYFKNTGNVKRRFRNDKVAVGAPGSPFIPVDDLGIVIGVPGSATILNPGQVMPWTFQAAAKQMLPTPPSISISVWGEPVLPPE